MAIPKIFRRKSFYIVLGLLLIGGLWYYRSNAASKQPVYETAAVEKRDLVQSVEVTGEIKPASRIDLAFKNSGYIEDVKVAVGSRVTKGDILASIQNDDVLYALRNAQASLSIATANLNARLAGETIQSIQVTEAQVASAQASYDKALSDLAAVKLTSQNTVKTSEVAAQTAKNNLENQEAIVAQNIQNSNDSARAAFNTALGPLQIALLDGDQITSVDNTASNSMYLGTLGILESGSLLRAQNSYKTAKSSKLAADQSVLSLSSFSSKIDIQTAGEKLLVAIVDMQTYLTDVQKLLAATITSTFLSSTELAAKKATIDTDRSSISAQATAVTTAVQSIKNTELVRTKTIAELQDAYTTAQTNLETAKTNANNQVVASEAAVAIQKAALDSAKASLDLKKAPPRNVDVASLRASVEQAASNFDKASNDLKNVQIIAPVDGIVSDVQPEVGELVQAGVAVIRLVGTEKFEIEALVPEADIVKIEVGQTATITLDAFGDDEVFEGSLTAEDPDLTKVQDAVYYKIRVQIQPNGKDVKPGMTANVIVKTDERKNVFVIPLRAIRTKDDNLTKVVRVKKNDQIEERVIEVGLRGDEGKVEVISGLAENEQVVVSETTPGKL